MPVVPNKDFNSFLSGGDPKKTPSIGMDDLSVSSPLYGAVTVPVSPVIYPQSSGVMDRNMGGDSFDYQYGNTPESTQVINNQPLPQPPPQPVTPYQNIIGSVLKSVQNNGKIINQVSDPVFDYIRQQQVSSIYPDLGDTNNADYYPSAGVMSTSTSDPIYGSFNQYATQSLTPYAIYDKRNAALQKAATASLPSGLKSTVPDAYVSYKEDVGEKTYKTTQDYIAEGQKLGYGKHTYEILEKGIGDLGQRYQRDINNINTIASKTKDIGKYVDTLYDEASKNNVAVPQVVMNAVNKFRSGANDLWNGKGTELELDKLVGQIQYAPNMLKTISDKKFKQDEFSTMIKDSGLTGIGQNKMLTNQEVKQVLKPRADMLAEEILNSNPVYKDIYTKDQISNMIIEVNGGQVKDIYKNVSLGKPSTTININNGDHKTTKDLVFQESGELTINQGYYPINGASTITGDRPTKVKYDYGLTLPEDARTTLKVKNTDIKKHNVGDSAVDNLSATEFSSGDAIGIYRLPIKSSDGRIFPEGNTDNMGWFALVETPVKALDVDGKVVTETHQYYVPFDQSLQQQFGYTVKELNNKIQKDIQLSKELNVEPDVPRNTVDSEDMRVFDSYGTYDGRRVIKYTNGDVEYAD